MSVDPRSGYCPETKTFHSLRPATPLPSPSLPLSLTSFALSLLPDPLPSNPALILHTPNSPLSPSLSFSSLLSFVHSLAASLSPSLPKGSLALILSPPSLHLPILHLALLSIGVVVSPINPLTTPSEIAHYIRLTKPSVAFAASLQFASILLPHLPTILLDSPQFQSRLNFKPAGPKASVEVRQSDPAAILYSSGTTGRVKGVLLTHRNFIALIAGFFESKKQNLLLNGDAGPAVVLYTVPLFHVFGFFMLFRNVALGETSVLMERFDFGAMLEAVERYRVTVMPVSPPIVVAMAKSDEALRRDLSSLKTLGCGGAPLRRDAAEWFRVRFPNILIAQGYGLTETTGGVAGMATPEEAAVHGSTGRLGSNVEARIVDPETGEAVGPGARGELWLRGPTVMKGPFALNHFVWN